MAKKNIFLYVPNIIGYIRLILATVSFYYMKTDPHLFLTFYCTSILLDGFDGFAARKLDQVTTFGAWLDVVIDNFSRGMLWSNVSVLGWLVNCFEWMVFVCTHTLGKQWKHVENSTPPVWVQAVMANGFKTPVGTFVIIGLDGLPIWLYLQNTGLLVHIFTPCVQAYFTILLCGGRLLCMTVEFWFILNHIRAMVAWDQLPKTPHVHTDYNHDDDGNDDDYYGDNAAWDRVKDGVAKEIRPRKPPPRRANIIKRQKGPPPLPTPGSTMINMGFASQGRRGSSPESPRRRTESTQPPQRRQAPSARRTVGIVRGPRSPGYPRERPRERSPREHSPGPRGRRIPDNLRRLPHDGAGPISAGERRRQPLRRFAEKDYRLRRSPDAQLRRRRSESPRGRQPVHGSPQGRRIRSVSPTERKEQQQNASPTPKLLRKNTDEKTKVNEKLSSLSQQGKFPSHHKITKNKSGKSSISSSQHHEEGLLTTQSLLQLRNKEHQSTPSRQSFSSTQDGLVKSKSTFQKQEEESKEQETPFNQHEKRRSIFGWIGKKTKPSSNTEESPQNDAETFEQDNEIMGSLTSMYNESPREPRKSIISWVTKHQDNTQPSNNTSNLITKSGSTTLLDTPSSSHETTTSHHEQDNTQPSNNTSNLIAESGSTTLLDTPSSSHETTTSSHHEHSRESFKNG